MSIYMSPFICDPPDGLQESFVRSVGYTELLVALQGLGQPSRELLESLIDMVGSALCS